MESWKFKEKREDKPESRGTYSRECICQKFREDICFLTFVEYLVFYSLYPMGNQMLTALVSTRSSNHLSSIFLTYNLVFSI